MHITCASLSDPLIEQSDHHKHLNAPVFVSLRTMTLDINHHCPVCAKKGNRRCVKLGHLIECEIHKGKFHSRIHECVSCAEACAREEKAAKKERSDRSAEDENKEQRKSRKNGKVKHAHEKTMKQLRKEMRKDKSKSSDD